MATRKTRTKATPVAKPVNPEVAPATPSPRAGTAKGFAGDNIGVTLQVGRFKVTHR